MYDADLLVNLTVFSLPINNESELDSFVFKFPEIMELMADCFASLLFPLIRQLIEFVFDLFSVPKTAWFSPLMNDRGASATNR